MTALKLSVDSLDGLDDSVKPLYQQREGKFVLDIADLDETIANATQKAKRAENEAINERKKRQQWEKLGKTPEEIEEILTATAKAEEEKATKAGEWDKLRAQINEKHAADLEKERIEKTALRKRLEGELIDSRAVTAIAAAKGIPDLLLPHVQRHVKVDENYNVIVVDAKGDPRVNGKGELLTIPDLVAELKQSEIFGRAFDGTGQSGSGTQPGNGGGNPQLKNLKKSDLTDRKARAAFVDQFGVKAYEQLPA